MSGIVIATYNVLADPYIKPKHYPRCDPQDFLPVNRHPRLVTYVATLGADVRLFQEVTYPMFEMLDARLRKDGFVGRWTHKGSGKPDGCATFVRAPHKVATWMSVDLHDDAASGHVALAAVVKHGRAFLTLVNAHIKWDKPDAAPEERHGIAQAKHLLQVLDGQRHTVIGMDANAEPDSDLMARFRHAGFIDAHPPDATFVLDGRPQKLDYLLHTSDLQAEAHPGRVLTPTSALPSPTEPSDHVPVIATFTPIA